MGTITVVEVIRRTSAVLKDPEGVRWPFIERQDWLNDGYRAVIDHRPDANAVIGALTCTPGTRQTIASLGPSAVRPLDITRNLSINSDRGAVRHTVRDHLDVTRPQWHDEPPTDDIQFWSFDPRIPTAFFVYPPATGTAQLEVIYAAIPAPHTLTELQLAAPTTTETIRLPDGYANQLVDYVLYRAYTKDAEDATMAARAAATYQAFLTALQVQTAVAGALTEATKA